MFPFYGAKRKIVKYYPKPIYDTIIEPFAGSAGYSQEYYDKNVILIEIDKKIYSTWKYLIECSPQDILNLPILKKGENLNNFNLLSIEEKYLLGFFLNPGSSTPKKSPGKFCKWDENARLKLSENIKKIKHWKIYNNSYEEAPDIEATYYIDPPYEIQGKWYMHNNKSIDYQKLGEWCQTRKGQVVVCENVGATWLPFEHLVELKGQKHKNTEVVWLNS